MATWVVTGGGRGIGRGLVERLLAEGENVVATVREPTVLAGLVAASDGRLKVIALDVADPAAVARLGELVEGPVDVLVNNAGVLMERNADTLAPELDWGVFEKSFRVNAIAPLFVTRALLPKLRRPGGKILMISSRMGSLAEDKSDTTAYRASKAALNRIARGLARDLEPAGIAVLTMHPGWVRTDMGGPGAAVSTAESVSGLIARVRALDIGSTGRFLDHTGDPLSW
ncbi:SDR family oxidoreductase [Oharaeibacter diazotrophicus]|uniref:Short-subunit dehydrogenase n=1 Tax=Oharaeibacter diazotrophicus TaxID=1920512 RepID=A0A4R6R9G9_9HYPH|nr:SDR family oxidoreductase [Oharaeibacter diazotrophicus]TDP82703.1 short-subunit dehydrogenase [Oharaeibacter diazotrophicus]BBE72535.1 C-factor [Pleomorphomonas sp. SM30]GLS76566.1 short-chain dehydrogenase [Oharaeibacter diazotrophicus]